MASSTDKEFKDDPLSDAELPAFLSRAAARAHRMHWKDPVPATCRSSPGFKPTRNQARLIEKLRALGISAREISTVLQIELGLLNFYYGYELKSARIRTNAAVAKVALTMALSGQNENMTKYWLNTQAGWSEKITIEHEGADAAADEARIARQKLLEEDNEPTPVATET